MPTNIKAFLETAGFKAENNLITVDLCNEKAMLKAGQNMELDSLCDKIYRVFLMYIVAFFSQPTADKELVSLAQANLHYFCSTNRERLGSVSYVGALKLKSFSYQLTPNK